MPRTVIETFSVKRLDILDVEGTVDEALMPPLSRDDIIRLYELLILSRTFDDRALSLQREGRIGTYPSILGQEAAQVGSAYALEKSDWVFPSFRETGMHITMGYPLPLLFQYWSGDERGLACPEGLNILPVSVSVGTHIPHAVGAAMAARYRKDRIAVAAYFGDGATSKGDFHEGFNMAGVFRLPVVFICQNNQWAISVPLARQTAAATLAQKALAYGFEGIQVDGNDVFAVYAATRQALERARSGGGPTFIECFTYRLSHHTTADDADRYRSAAEVTEWKKRDPLERLRLYMDKRGFWSEGYQRELDERARGIIDAAVRTAESAAPPQGRDIFVSVFDQCTPRQTRDMEGVKDADV
ncbi:pyruvate dehydrogenase (acetyl-transferring) E1 component subunit alpha [bacterium]|nr:pyruvate dehydrogenase (acetyl-transferring) E1 component subunit alpha [bacterium]